MTDLQIYEKYCHNKPRSESLWRQCSDCAFFQVDKQDFTQEKKKKHYWVWFDTVCVLKPGVSEKAGAQAGLRFLSAEACSEDHKISAASQGTLLLLLFFYIFLSGVRCEYVYVFSDQEMLKYSKTCEGANDLQEALTSILGILKAVNDSMHLIAITGYEVSSSNVLAVWLWRAWKGGGGVCQRWADNWL